MASPANSNVANGKFSGETRTSEGTRSTDKMLIDTLGSGKM